MKTGQAILLLAICVVAYIELTRDEEKGVGEGGMNFASGYPNSLNDGYCSNPKASNWNPLAPPNKTRGEMFVTCSGLPETDVIDQENGQAKTSQVHDRLYSQFSICTSDLTGQYVTMRQSKGYPEGGPTHGAFEGNFDTLSYCLPGEWVLGQLTRAAFMVAPEDTFGEYYLSVPSYELHEFANLEDNLGVLGDLQEGDKVSIQKFHDNVSYKIQDIMDYLWTPTEANKFGLTDESEFFHAHPSHDELMQALAQWKQSPIAAASQNVFRRVGDPRFPHPVDFDLDNSGQVVWPPSVGGVGGQFQDLSEEKRAFMEFFLTFSGVGEGPMTIEDIDPKFHKMFAILDFDKDGVVDAQDFHRMVELNNLAVEGYSVPQSGQTIAEDDAAMVGNSYAVSGIKQHYSSHGTASYNKPYAPLGMPTDPFDEDGVFAGMSSQYVYAGFGFTQGLEECYDLRLPLHPMASNGDYYPENSGCERMFRRYDIDPTIGGESHVSALSEIPVNRWVEVLYATDGLACSNDEGQTLCFPFSESEKLAAAQEYLDVIRPRLGLGETDPEMDWETGEVISYPEPDPAVTQYVRYQEDSTLNGTEGALSIGATGANYPAADEEFRVLLKSNTQCPASHPNFQRFCLTRRTLPSLVGPPDQIAPVYDRDDIIEGTTQIT